MSRTVIKAGDARVESRGAYSFDLRDISRDAEAIIAAGRAEADRLVAQARKQIEIERQAALEEAKREGHEAGFASGREEGHAEALVEAREQLAQEQASLLSALTALVDEFGAERDRLYVAAKRDVIVLASAVAGRVVTKLTEVDDIATDAAVKACEEALDLVRGATAVVIRANPEDCRTLESMADDLNRTVKASGHVRVVEDASVGRGGVIVGSDDTVVDATAGSRVERVAAELAANWRERVERLSLNQ
jgi:flagellar assembly protein FliH